MINPDGRTVIEDGGGLSSYQSLQPREGGRKMDRLQRRSIIFLAGALVKLELWARDA